MSFWLSTPSTLEVFRPARRHCRYLYRQVSRLVRADFGHVPDQIQPTPRLRQNPNQGVDGGSRTEQD